MSKKRDLHLDLIRCVAVLFVLSVHFFLNIGFYDTTVAGKRMYVMVLMRSAFMVCVPMFLMLTGYLCTNKKLSRTYYGGIRHTLEVYLLVSIMCLLFHRFYLHESITFKDGLFRILSYSASSYGWYIEMYLGLFLLIPFLNILYHGLDTQRKKQALIVTFLVLTTLPTLTNIYDWYTPGFWSNPAKSTTMNQILPAWWTFLYPLTYYFIGSYIREYDIHIAPGKNLALLLGCILVFGSYNYYRTHGDTFGWPIYTGRYSFENVINSILTFTLLLHVDLSRCPRPVSALITKVSQLSLGIYLASSISDKLLYPILKAYVYGTTPRLNYFPLVVLSTFLIAALLSQLAQWLLIPLDRLINAAAARIKSRGKQTPV